MAHGRSILGVGIAAMVTLAGADLAVAQSGLRQTFAASFTTGHGASPTGFRESIDYANPDDPSGKPWAVQRIAVALHPGARIDTSVPEQCKAADSELMLQGAAACPPGSRVGGGEVDVDAGMAAGPIPRVIHSRATFFNNDHQLILFTESVNTPGAPVRTAGRVAVGERTFTNEVPPIPAFPPPDPFLAVKRVRIVLDSISTGPGRSFITTPATCPATHSWSTAATFSYRDGVTQTVSAASPCTRPHASRPSSSKKAKKRRRARKHHKSRRQRAAGPRSAG
jgi:hypothetical protein